MKTPKHQRNAYEILGVGRDATILDIDAAWQRKLRESRPENSQTMGERERALAKAEVEQINNAYQTLSNASTRSHYDRLLARYEAASVRLNQELDNKMSKRAEVANERAIAQWEQGNFAQAIAQWEAIVAHEPNIAEIHHNLGNAYAQQGALDEAIESLKRAIAIDPRLIEAYNKLGCIFFKQNRLELAHASWRHALKIDPDFKEALHNLRLVQQSTTLNASGDVPAYQHDGSNADGAANDDSKTSWKARIRQRLKDFRKP